MTKKYKTLKGLFKYNGINQLDFNDFVNRRVFSQLKGYWIQFKLEEKAREEACELFASALCATKPAIEKYTELIKNYSGRSHVGIFDRLWINVGKNSNFRGVYCAGQDYESEVRYVQYLIRR